jgi:hypothetical protein
LGEARAVFTKHGFEASEPVAKNIKSKTSIEICLERKAEGKRDKIS